jgi:hypothetical protein
VLVDQRRKKPFSQRIRFVIQDMHRRRIVDQYPFKVVSPENSLYQRNAVFQKADWQA